MVLESPGGQPHESDRLGGQEAPSGTTEPEARRAPEALALEVPSFQDLIVTFPEDILHEGALVASEIDTGASDLETAKAPVDAREVDPQSEDLRCLVAARLEETRQVEIIDMRGQGHHEETGSAIDRATWIASVIEIGIVKGMKETGSGTGSGIPKGEMKDGHAPHFPEIAVARDLPHLAKQLLSLHGAHLIGHALDHRTDETTDFNPLSDTRHCGNLDHHPRYRLDLLRRGRIPNHNHNLRRLAHLLH